MQKYRNFHKRETTHVKKETKYSKIVTSPVLIKNKGSYRDATKILTSQN